MQNEITIKLSFFEGSLTRSDISRLFGLKSDKKASSKAVWVKCWHFNPKEKYVKDEIDDVVNRLYQMRNRLQKIDNEAELSISGCLYSSGSIGIHFKKDTLEKLGSLNIPLDIDLYDLSKDAETP